MTALRVAIDPVDELRSVLNRYGEPWRERKGALLELCAASPFDDRRSLLKYHDCLLFLHAYPDDRELLGVARGELRRIAEIAREVSRQRTRSGESILYDTGIAWSEVSRDFSYPVARWLAREHPRHASVDADEGDCENLRRTLALSLPPLEFSLAEETRTSAELFACAKKADSSTDLEWLVAQMERLPCDERIREHLFEKLDLRIRLRPLGGSLSRTFARGPDVRAFTYARGLLREFDLQQLIAQPLPPARRLSAAERTGAIDAGRGVLAMLGRETDVIARARAEGLQAFDLERGAGVVLYAMPPEERFPLDTHVGFLFFKNAVPVAYGGGWPFLGTCKIGINVFEPFRGGESAHVFGQVLRVYAQRFAAERFLVEPYQIGEHNPEGVRSGAFWFYYRMGFRPVGARHANLARAEFERIAAERGYRAPLGVMRRLSHADLELPVTFRPQPPGEWPDPSRLSAAVSAWISREFDGDRDAAERIARGRVESLLGVDVAGWTPAERAAFASLALLFAAAPGLDAWSERDRRAARAVIRAKGHDDEGEFAGRSTAHRALRRALAQLISS